MFSLYQNGIIFVIVDFSFNYKIYLNENNFLFVYLTDFNQAPFAGDWSKASAYKEYRIATKKDGTIVKYVDDSLVDEDIETLATEEKY